jgi:iron complex transport system substrate-binding protein
MALNDSPGVGSTARRAIPVTLFAVGLLVAAGVSIGATAAYLELFAKSPGPTGPGSVSVVDDRGRTVNAPTNPTRVAVFGPNLVDSLVRLGLRSSIVGVDCSPATYGGLLGDYTPNQTAAWQLTSALCIQAFPAVNTEELLNKSPQLVFVTSIVSESSIDEFSVTYHVPVVWMIPSSLSGIVVDVETLAKIFPSAHGATALEASLQAVLANAATYVTNLTGTVNASIPSVLLTYYVDPAAGYYTYGPGTFGDSLVNLAGGVSVSAGARVQYPVVPGSTVLADNPQVIIYGVGPLGEPLSAYQQAPDWSSLTGQKVPLDVTLFTEADPTMILVGLPAMVALLHPGVVV